MFFQRLCQCGSAWHYEYVYDAGVPKEVIEPMIAQIPLRRMGEPEDITNVVVFLASEKASYISGVVLRVDGLARC